MATRYPPRTARFNCLPELSTGRALGIFNIGGSREIAAATKLVFAVYPGLRGLRSIIVVPPGHVFDSPPLFQISAQAHRCSMRSLMCPSRFSFPDFWLISLYTSGIRSGCPHLPIDHFA
jgi:hypothetical protein